MKAQTLTALLTPFADGKIDVPSLEKIIDWQIEQGIDGLVVCGATGEGMLLNHIEREQVIITAIAAAKGRVPIIVGTGSFSTEQTISLSLQAQELGADGLMIVAPPYVKPSQQGLYEHYWKIADAVNIPIIVYNNPARVGAMVTTETLARLAKHPNIIGVKDSTGNALMATEILNEIGSDFLQYSGDDAPTPSFLAQGGYGWISTSSNIAPRLCSDLVKAWKTGDLKTVQQIRDQTHQLFQSMFCEGNPAPVKYAASKLGLCNNELRLPLAPVGQKSKDLIDAAMQRAGLT